jgi:hypothetical protein
MEDLKLIHIHTTPDQATAELVKGFLESNNIKAFIKANPGPDGAILGEFGGHAPFNPWMIYVSEDKAEEVKKLLDDFNEK